MYLQYKNGTGYRKITLLHLQNRNGAGYRNISQYAVEIRNRPCSTVKTSFVHLQYAHGQVNVRVP